MNRKEAKSGAESKTCRMLSLYERLNRGDVKSKQNLAAAYGVDEKTIQRDIRDFIWKISISVQEQKLVYAKYQRQDGRIKEYKLKPLGLVFSEYYFYLVGEIVGKDGNYPVVFRVDRFEKYDITEEKFSMPYKDRFEEGEFHKKIQFMYTGELRSI